MKEEKAAKKQKRKRVEAINIINRETGLEKEKRFVD